MIYHVQFDTCVWSLLNDNTNLDKSGKKEIWKKATIKLLEIFERDKSFVLSIAPLVLEELSENIKKNRVALEFIQKHNIDILKMDIFYGFILGDRKHRILGKSPLGVDIHPTSNLIDHDKRLSKENQAKDREILKHNINNEVDYLITYNEKDFTKNKNIRTMIKFPDEFLKILEKEKNKQKPQSPTEASPKGLS